MMATAWTHLPLGGHCAETGGDTEEEGVEFGELLESDDGVVGFGGSMELRKDFGAESLRNSVARAVQ